MCLHLSVILFTGEGLCLGGLCLGDLCPGVSLSREVRDPPYSKERVVIILLECILVHFCNLPISLECGVRDTALFGISRGSVSITSF